MSTWLIALILTLGIARLTLIIVKDDIAKHLRHWVFKHSPPDTTHTELWKATPEETGVGFTAGKRWPLNRYIEVEMEGAYKPGWWGSVFSCPDCAGPYVAAATLLGYHLLPTATLYVMMVLAVSMVTSLIARRY